MLLPASGTYFLVAITAALASYVVAHRKGLNAVGWAWASLFLLVPAVILPFVRTRRASAPPAGIPDANWHALLAYDPEIKAAAARLAPFGAPALDDLRRAWEAVPNKGALPEMVSDIEARWSVRASAGLTHVETRDGARCCGTRPVGITSAGTKPPILPRHASWPRPARAERA